MAKYIIFENLEKCSLYLDILNRNLKIERLIRDIETWDIPHRVGSKTNNESKRYWMNTPPDKWLKYAPRFYEEESDDDLDELEENIYKIYTFVNEDADKKVNNYLISPKSLDYKKDVSIRFAPVETFDVYGNLIKVEYYENETVDINPLGVKTVTQTNKIVEAEFNYVYGNDGYLNYRDSTRRWYRLDGSEDAVVVKRKNYNNNKAKKAGVRRRTNVKNIMEQKVGTALFLNRGSSLVGGDDTFTTVSQADDYGRPLLNTLSDVMYKYIDNNEHTGLLDAINNIDTVEFDWVLDIDPFTGKTIQQLAYDIFNDSYLA
jgi:hypothetical protein